MFPEPKISLVGAMEMRDTAENSDENFTCLIELLSRLSLLRQKNVQKVCAHFGLEAFAVIGIEKKRMPFDIQRTVYCDIFL